MLSHGAAQENIEIHAIMKQKESQTSMLGLRSTVKSDDNGSGDLTWK